MDTCFFDVGIGISTRVVARSSICFPNLTLVVHRSHSPVVSHFHAYLLVSNFGVLRSNSGCTTLCR